ncbi:MAG: aminotransferase class III-fold pyridoxal phosphate-dependent enzyme [Gemmatimonadota bacterium]|nr:aminotransferase class III-fold pyridoxal phosphate-dependent enzyme [Gemmatimonadota bacterium]
MIDSAVSHWSAALADAWGLDGMLEPLAGEFDLNIRVRATDGRRFVLKVMRASCAVELVALLTEAHVHLRSRDASVPAPALVPTRNGADWCLRPDADGAPRLLWLLEHLEGCEYAQVREHTGAQTLAVAAQLGAAVARLHGALADFTHDALARPLKWDLCAAHWIGAHLDEFADPARRTIVATILARYQRLGDALRAEPTVVLHNDLNDWNLLVVRDPHGALQLTGIIDFGDMLRGPAVAELAIAGAYLVLDHAHPERVLAALVAGYHRVSPLSGPQLDVIWPLLLTRLAVSVTNSALMHRARPDDAYVVVSERPAWAFLERASAMHESVVSARLRAECGLAASDAAERTVAWLHTARGTFAPVMSQSLASMPVGSLAVAAVAAPEDPTGMTFDEARVLGLAAGVGPVWVGGYAEPRAVYTAPAFRRGVHPIADRRSVHIGVDVFLPAGTPVQAPCDGVVEVVEYHDRSLDYGGMIVLRHVTPDGDTFWTLYGHLSRASAEGVTAGQRIAQGEAFAALGDVHENGGWDPHVHFQLLTTLDGMRGDWPGVADPDDLALWKALCPNPAALLNLADDVVAYLPLDESAVRAERDAHFASNLRLSYRAPCLLVRGWQHYVYDQWGRTYLDAYNNVPHVGHAHPRLRAVVHDQMGRLNSNTRYLHPAQLAFAESLLATVPSRFTHVFLVNSGSEANELALRLSRTRTGARDMITPDHGYHGNTTGAYDISAYKFDKPNGGGRPDWVQLVPVADTYRGAHRGPDAATQYAAYVDDAIARIHARGARVAGFIAETFPSVGGQIIPPVGYLQGVYARIRAAGGVCIADEVQTGLGRLGDFFWGFEQQQVEPDIVVLGKPLGNGHPMGAVLTTSDIAHAFDNGIEFFSTFGGSTVSCRVGTEVLRIVQDEGLQENARAVGDVLRSGLRDLQRAYPLVGDVRGMGLFIGVELVNNPDTRAPATAAASYVVNRLREERILIGTEGPDDNVLKIRPPLTVRAADVTWLVEVLGRVLGEWAHSARTTWR